MTQQLDRAAATRAARHAHEYLAIAKHADPRRGRPRAVARAEFLAEQAFAWAIRRPGYRDAVIAADGLLVVLVLASEAGIGRRGFVVSIEHEIEPRALDFLSGSRARKFLRDATAIGARRAALALDRALAPAEQVELFPLAAVVCAA